jgi:hypothetical protein
MWRWVELAVLRSAELSGAGLAVGTWIEFGFGAGDEDGGSDDEVHAPELLMAGDVLCGNAAGALGESGFVTRLLGGGEFALGVSVEIGAVAVESEHEEEFGVQARGGDVVGGEAGDGRGEGWLQLHLYISTQSGCGRLSRPVVAPVTWVLRFAQDDKAREG